jgi:hypothetical protein
MSQFPFLMNNQSLVGNGKAICFFNQDENYEVGTPDDSQLNNDSQIDVLLGDMLNSTQDQAVLQNDGHSQANTSTLSQLCHNTSIHHHPPNNPIIEDYKPFNLDAVLPSSFTFQMALSCICDHHRTDIKLFNKINQLIQQHSIGQQLSFLTDNLTNRLSFVKKLATSFKMETLKHEGVNVSLALGGDAIMAVFDIEAQILSLLIDESIMQQDNIANGYDNRVMKKLNFRVGVGRLKFSESWQS